jgi:hypothetical protein
VEVNLAPVTTTPADVTPNELRDKATGLHKSLFGPGRAVTVRPDQHLLAELPVGPGADLLVLFSGRTSPPTNWRQAMGDAQLILQIVTRRIDNGQRMAGSSVIRICTSALPSFAGAVAKALELADERLEPLRRSAPPEQQQDDPP